MIAIKGKGRIEDALRPSDLHIYLKLKADGTLIWRKRAGNSRGVLAFNGRFAGTVAGSRKDTSRYVDVRITTEDGAFYLTKAHRIVIAMCDGKWPPPDKQVDHIDGNTQNNSRRNLRVCSNMENSWNIGVSKSNSSGFKGVRYHVRDKVYHARIRARGSCFHLGSYGSAEDAARAYDEAATKYHGEFARTNQALGRLI